jgi:hypothetical protein
MTTRINLINRAASRIGAGRLKDENAPGAEIRIGIYDGVVEDLLSRYPWTFARKKRQLARLAVQPDAHFTYLFQLPTDMIGLPRAVYDSPDERAKPVMAWELGEAGLASSFEQVWALYTIKAPPQAWPGFFRELIVLAVAAEYALSIREDKSLRSELRNDVYGSAAALGESGMLAQAKNMDAQASPSPSIPVTGNPLITVRHGGW